MIVFAHAQLLSDRLREYVRLKLDEDGRLP